MTLAQKRIYVASSDDADFPKRLPDVVAFFAAALAQVPIEHRPDVVVEIDTDYESSYWSIEVYYARLETAAEAEARAVGERSLAEQRERAQRATELRHLAYLRAKYPEAP